MTKKETSKITFCMNATSHERMEKVRQENPLFTWRRFIENGLAQYQEDSKVLADLANKPKRNAPVTTYLGRQEIEKIQKIAKEHGLSISKTIEALIQIGAQHMKEILN